MTGTEKYDSRFEPTQNEPKILTKEEIEEMQRHLQNVSSYRRSSIVKVQQWLFDNAKELLGLALKYKRLMETENKNTKD